MPCWKFKNSFIHRLFLCYYCTPEDERPKRKVRPGKGQGGSFRVTGQQPANTQSPEDGFMSIETQTNISVPSTGYMSYQCSNNNNNNNQIDDQSDGFFSSSYSSTGSNSAPISSSSEVTPEVLMTWVNDVLSEDLVQEVNAIYKFVIVDDAKCQSVYYLDLKNGQGSVGQGEPPVEADVVLTSSLRNMQLLMNGKLSKVSAYLTGRLKVEGDKNAAYNLDKVITLVQQS